MYYGKYAYRLSVYCAVAGIFRNKDFNYARYRLDLWNQDIADGVQPRLGLYRGGDLIAVSDIHFGLTLLNIFKRAPNEFLLRIENRTINIFSNDSKWLEHLDQLLGSEAYELVRPENENVAKYLLANPKHQITPHNGFEYKITTKFVRKGFASFGTWCSNTDKVKISKKFKEELLDDSILHDGRIIYVKDEKTLNIVTLFISEGIRSIIYLIDPKEIDI